MASITRVPNRPDYLTGFSSGAEQTSEAGPGLIDKAKDVAADVIEKVEDAASAVKQTTQEAASFVGHRASAAAAVAGQGLSADAGYVRHTASDAADGLTNLIRKYPIPSLLVSFAIGLLLSRAMRR